MSMGSPAIPSHRNSHKTDSPVDAVDRHDFGVQKNRKYPSTGGGRAWTEDEVSACSRVRCLPGSRLTVVVILGGLPSSDSSAEDAL